MKYKSHIIFALIIAILNTSCAISMLGNEYSASYTASGRTFDEDGVQPLYENRGKAISMFTNCGDDSFFSWMISIIIPLPPILPSFVGLARPRISLRLNGEGFTANSPKMVVSHQEYVFETDGSYERPYSKTDIAWIYWYPPDKFSCMDLDNATIKFVGILHEGIPVALPPVQINIEDRGLSIGFAYYDT